MMHRWICACGTQSGWHPEARQAVHTEKQDILYAPVLQVIQHSQPELGGFVLHLL